jgi:hypothetical protein
MDINIEDQILTCHYLKIGGSACMFHISYGAMASRP